MFSLAMAYANFNLVNIMHLFKLYCYICTGFEMFRFRIILKSGKSLARNKCTNCINPLDQGNTANNATRTNFIFN